MSDLQTRVNAVVSERVPGVLGLEKIERLSGGASQETYRLTARTATGTKLLAMRRAPGGAIQEPSPGHPGLAVEAKLMQVASSAGVPEPEVYCVLQPDDGIGDGFLMEWLEGEALGARIVRAPELAHTREHLAFSCGEILARIHQIDVKATGLDRVLDVIDPEAYIRQTWERYKEFPTPAPMIDYTARWLLEHLPKNPKLALVHNDFRNGNVMVDAQGVVAVLDWEVAHIGDPMRDLGWICTNSWRFGRTDLAVGGFGTYADLFAGYESVSGQAVDAAQVKFWEVFGSFWWAVGCLGMAEHYRTGPDQTVERPAIGRRSSECQVDCVNLLIPGQPSRIPTGQSKASVDQAHNMPTTAELLISVRDFLRTDVMPQTEGRTSFLARVASNSLDIVLRELDLGALSWGQDLANLCDYFAVAQGSASLDPLVWQLVNEVRNEAGSTLDLTDAKLTKYLRESVISRVAIDQPKYSGLATALNFTN